MNFFRKYLFIYFVIFLFTIGTAIADAPSRVNDTVEGTEVVTFPLIDTTGAWQAISVPATIENVRHIAIQVHNGTATDYTHIDNVVEFQLSSSGADTDFFYTSGIVISVGKSRSEAIIYLKAAISQKIAILGLR